MDHDLSREEIMTLLGLRDEKNFRENYQQSGVHAGLIAMTLPEKPTSRFQRYRLTAAGELLRKRLLAARAVPPKS